MQIVTGQDNPILRTPCEPIDLGNIKKYKSLAREMVEYVENPKNGGVGLAAPQIGKNIRLAAVSLLKTWEDDDYETIAMVNPEILSVSEETETETEGCLSLPGITGLVTRPRTIRVRWRAISGMIHEQSFSGVPARVIQHEIDHLNGILFIDKVVGPLQYHNS